MVWNGNKAPQQPDDDSTALAQWVEDELSRFSTDQLENIQAIDLRPSYNAPLRPREAMIVYADGTKWNPGKGAGPYYYTAAGVWAPLWWGREPLTAARTYFVRTDGSDTNTGLVNTAGGAFLTIAKALAVAATLDCLGFQLTITVGAGTWTVPIVLPNVLASLAPILTGVGSTTIINVTGEAILNNGNCLWQINSMKLVATTNGLHVKNGGTLNFSGIEFGVCGSQQMYCELFGAIVANGNYSISGGTFLHGLSNGTIDLTGRTVTITGTPAFGAAFAWASQAGRFIGQSMTFVGAATGGRYNVQSNGVIDSGGGGAAYFPGNVAGTAVTGGQYV